MVRVGIGGPCFRVIVFWPQGRVRVFVGAGVAGAAAGASQRDAIAKSRKPSPEPSERKRRDSHEWDPRVRVIGGRVRQLIHISSASTQGLTQGRPVDPGGGRRTAPDRARRRRPDTFAHGRWLFGASVGRRLPPYALAAVAAGCGMSGGVFVASGRCRGRCTGSFV